MKIGFLGILTIVLIVLRLTGFISWGWLAVFSPSILAVLLWVFAVVVFAVIAARKNR